MLLESSMSLKSLNDSHQFIQVFRRGGMVCFKVALLF
jgi:hypothetical protein